MRTPTILLPLAFLAALSGPAQGEDRDVRKLEPAVR
jgi:hypothetical protein